MGMEGPIIIIIIIIILIIYLIRLLSLYILGNVYLSHTVNNFKNA
jgi:branched-subunit amino acid transport protein